MKLYLLRHGEAEALTGNDAGRNLTAAGRRDVREIARRFHAAGLRYERCWVSPFLRARQSAEIFLAQTAPRLEPAVREGLRPEGSVRELIRSIGQQDCASLLLVSHNPLLSELHALLTEGDLNNLLILGPGDLVAVEFELVGIGLGRRTHYLSPDPRFADV